MRLLSIFPSVVRGGTEEYLLRVSAAAHAAGWEVHGGWPVSAGLQSFVDDWQNLGMKYHPLAISVANDSPRTLTRTHHLVRCWRTLRLLWKVRPRVVLLALPWPTVGLGAIVACALARIPTLVSFTLVPWPAEVAGKTLSAYQWAQKQRQLWVTNSKDGQRNINQTFQLDAEAVRVIRNGVKVSQFARDISDDERQRIGQELRKELGVAADARLLVTVARLHEQKGYGDLLSAAEQLLPEFADIRFVWVGDGDLRQTLEHALRKAGIADRVLMTGFRSDLARFYLSADLFVFPTHFEGGASFALVEALAYGAPVVSSDASGIPEVIEPGVHGLLYPAKNVEALTKSVRFALDHPDEMAQMARRGRERAADFTEERMCRDTLDALQELGSTRLL